MKDINKRLTDLEGQSKPHKKPSYQAFITLGEYELAAARGDVVAHKIYIHISPEDWDERNNEVFK